MSKLLFMSLLVLISCNEQKTKKSSLGRIKTFEPVTVEGTDLTNITRICRALSMKQDQIGVMIQTAREYSFNFSQKNCTDGNFSEAKTVLTTIQTNNTNTSYRFIPKNGEAFGLNEVETYSAGILSEICQSLTQGYAQNPVQTSPTGAMWFSTANTANCKSDNDSLCIVFSKGTAVGNDQYEIYADEWIKFNVSNDRNKVGFFEERLLQTNASCSKKSDTFQMKATLN